MEVRFNILNKYVNKFVISEAKYSHSGEKKKLNFDINKFSEFKKKIIYLVIDNEPANVVYKRKNNNLFEDDSDKRTNSVKRIDYQRDGLAEGLEDAKEILGRPNKAKPDSDEIINFLLLIFFIIYLPAIAFIKSDELSGCKLTLTKIIDRTINKYNNGPRYLLLFSIAIHNCLLLE